MFSFLYRYFHAAVDAFCCPSLPFVTRLRLLCLQPLNLLIYTYKSSHKLSLLHPGYKVRHIPTRRPGLSRRCVVYNVGQVLSGSRLRPLHLNVHGGAWIGGLPESDHEFCSHIAKNTGAVVVSASYRFAPRYPFPAAIDDIDDIVAWLVVNASKELGADPNLFTVSGFSAGGNMVLAASQSMQGNVRIRGAVTINAAVCTMKIQGTLRNNV